MEKIVIMIIVGVAAGIILLQRYYYRRENARLLDRLDRMIQDTMDQNLTVRHYDESKLSALEEKLYRYLRMSSRTGEQLLLEKERIQTLISDIAHQTKTPIANLVLYSQLLTEQEIPEQGRELIHQINVYADKLRFLIDALVKVSRLESGIIQLQPKQNAVKPLLEHIFEELSVQAEDKGIDFQLRAGPDLGEITGMFDSRWTEEAIGNIVDNAVKYTPRRGAVEVVVKEYPQFLCVDIRDNGPGMSEEEINHIFKRFYRRPQDAAQEGVGLGLYLAREIINRQSGYVKVNSRSGEGTVFSVFLPRVPME